MTRCPGDELGSAAGKRSARILRPCWGTWKWSKFPWKAMENPWTVDGWGWFCHVLLVKVLFFCWWNQGFSMIFLKWVDRLIACRIWRVAPLRWLCNFSGALGLGTHKHWNVRIAATITTSSGDIGRSRQQQLWHSKKCGDMYIQSMICAVYENIYLPWPKHGLFSHKGLFIGLHIATNWEIPLLMVGWPHPM